jgi:hypothetical protein
MVGPRYIWKRFGRVPGQCQEIPNTASSDAMLAKPVQSLLELAAIFGAKVWLVALVATLAILNA